MENAISIIGSLASIGAAIWAFIEASKAKKSAVKAQLIKNELISNRKLEEVVNLQSRTRSILIAVQKVGRSCTKEKLRGVVVADIAKEVEDYASFINEHCAHFDKGIRNKAKTLSKELDPLIERLTDAVAFEDIKKNGRSIYALIDAFLPEVKNLADNKKEHTSAI